MKISFLLLVIFYLLQTVLTLYSASFWRANFRVKNILKNIV